jgi:hypothetical protein
LALGLSLLLGGGPALWPSAATAAAHLVGGFDVSRSRVPAEQILEGGPGRDGIRAVDEPVFVAAEEATWVAATNPVLGVVRGEDARTYPVHLIERHQVVNDSVDGEPLVVTFDPLAGAPRAYRRQVDGETLSFGVSGLIHNHGFLLYDRQTESLWVQFTGVAIAGPMAGKKLSPVRVRQEAFGVWRDRYPRTRVLERPLPQLDYELSPFLRYIVEDSAIFPVLASDPRFHQKEVVLGVTVDGTTRAYLGSLMTAAGGRAEDEIAGRKIRLTYDPGEAVFTFDAPDDVSVQESYWLTWKAFHPGTEVWNDPALAAGDDGE